jgi:hypothetical protein
MLTINDGEALPCALDPSLRELIKLRVNQLRQDYDGPLNDIVCFYVVEANDGQEQMAQALGFSPLRNLVDGTTFGDPDFAPSFEWIEDHGYAFELVFIFDESGFAHVVIIEQTEEVHPELLKLCAAYATVQV